MTRRTTQLFIFWLISSGVIWYVHFGTPCTVWSRARHNIVNQQRAYQRELVGIALALFTARICEAVSDLNLFFSIENPKTSRLWEFTPISNLLKLRNVRMVHFDLCQYGRPYRKSTSLMTNMPVLDSLARKCTRDHVHTILVGRERVWTGGRWEWKNRTAGAGAYPPDLANAWAELVASVAPANCAGKTSERSERSFLESLKIAAQK